MCRSPRNQAGPARSGSRRIGGSADHCAGAREVDMNGVMRLDAGANVGHADQHIPGAGWNGTRQTGWRGVHQSDGQRGFVAAAPAAQPRGIEQTEIECGVLLFFGVGKGDGHALRAVGHRKGNLDIALVLGAANDALEGEIGAGRIRDGRGLLCDGGGGGERENKKKAKWRHKSERRCCTTRWFPLHKDIIVPVAWLRMVAIQNARPEPVAATLSQRKTRIQSGVLRRMRDLTKTRLGGRVP